MIGVYLYIVSENDWDFSIVTIDYYMLLGWLIPLGGLCFFAVMFIYYYFTLKRTEKPSLEENFTNRISGNLY